MWQNGCSLISAVVPWCHFRLPPWVNSWSAEIHLTHLHTGPNGCHFTDNILKCIFMNEKSCILIWISIKFVPMSLITLTPHMVLPLFFTRFAAYTGGIRVSFIQTRLFQFDIKFSTFLHYLNQCWPSSLTHICGTRERWVNRLRPEQDGRYFADNIFKCIVWNENFWIANQISFK